MKELFRRIFRSVRSWFVSMREIDDLIDGLKDADLTKTQMENEDYKFVWGVKSQDDLSSSEPSLYTMNDIDIVLRKSDNKYVLDIETAYWFDTKDDEIKYLERLLGLFTDYMTQNNYKTDDQYILWMSQPTADMSERTLADLYTNFRIFVEGFKSIHSSRKE